MQQEVAAAATTSLPDASSQLGVNGTEAPDDIQAPEHRGKADSSDGVHSYSTTGAAEDGPKRILGAGAAFLIPIARAQARLFARAAALKLILAIVATCLVVGGGYYFWQGYPASSGPALVGMFAPSIPEEDQRAWDAANLARSLPGFANYVSVQPKGYYVSQAREAMQRRQDEIEAAWQQAQVARTSAALRDFLNRYAADDRHIQEARALLPEIEQQERRVRDENIRVQRRLVRAGIAIPSITGGISETASAIRSFQRSANIPESGVLDSRTDLAIDQAIEKIRETEEAYNQARRARTRQSYDEFLNRYGASSYAGTVKALLAQCRLERRSRTVVETSEVSQTGQASGSLEPEAREKARAGALSTASSACTITGGTAGTTRYEAETCRENPAAAIVGGLLCGILTAGRQRCTSYNCNTTLKLECRKSVTTSQEEEICP